jgi:hypothetical protein
MDDYSLLSFLLPPHLLIAPLGVDCKFAVPSIKKKKLETKGCMLQLLGSYRTFSYLLSLIFLFVILDLSTCVSVSWRSISL